MKFNRACLILPYGKFWNFIYKIALQEFYAENRSDNDFIKIFHNLYQWRRENFYYMLGLASVIIHS